MEALAQKKSKPEYRCKVVSGMFCQGNNFAQRLYSICRTNHSSDSTFAATV